MQLILIGRLCPGLLYARWTTPQTLRPQTAEALASKTYRRHGRLYRVPAIRFLGLVPASHLSSANINHCCWYPPLGLTLCNKIVCNKIATAASIKLGGWAYCSSIHLIIPPDLGQAGLVIVA